MKLPELVYTSPVQFTRKQRMQLAVIPPVASALAKALCAFNRCEVRNAHYLSETLDEHGMAIVGIWHETALMAAAHHRGNNFHALTSYSFDGELAARLLACYGIESVRGSSSRGGSAGLHQLEKALPLVRVVGLTMDGPRGPHREAKPGVAILAARTGAPIVPNAFVASRCWRLRTWDRFPVPKAFGTIVCAFGEPIFAPEVTTPESIEETRLQVQNALNALHAEIEREFAE